MSHAVGSCKIVKEVIPMGTMDELKGKAKAVGENIKDGFEDVKDKVEGKIDEAKGYAEEKE